MADKQHEAPGGNPEASQNVNDVSTPNCTVPPAGVESQSFAENAIRLASLGWRVFPCHHVTRSGRCSCGKLECEAPGKHPRFSGWQQKAATDRKTILGWGTKWPNANVGLATGEAFGLFVLDVDPKNGGAASLADIEREHGALPETVTVLTGGGGQHYYFTHPGIPVKNSSSDIAPGIDIRGDGGLVIAPGSNHVSGRRYEFECQGDPFDGVTPAAPPAWLLQYFAGVEGKSLGAKFVLPDEIPDGTRDNTLFSYGCSLRAMGRDESEITEALTKANTERCKPPKDASLPADLAKRICEKYEAGRRATTSDDDAGGTCADLLLDLVETRCDLFQTRGGDRYATTPEGDTFPLWRGGGLRDWMIRTYRQVTGKTPHSTGLAQANAAVLAEAAIAPIRTVGIRTAEADGAIWVDLANDRHEVVKVTASGWTITTELPEDLRFRRPRDMQPLPTPVSGANGLTDLQGILNTAEEPGGFVLVVSWMLGALRPGYPYPVLAIVGEHGSAKSTATRIVRTLVDPNGEDGRALTRPPRDDRDLFSIANQAHVLALENVSHISPDLSDSLSSISTGSGLQIRQLYTDNDVVSVYCKRPITFNGIAASGADIAKQSDLLDRCICVPMKVISDELRITENDLWPEVQRIAPAVLGDLLDATSCAMRNIVTIHAPQLPRMADFGKWIMAAEEVLPWETGTFSNVYAENREEATEALLDNDPIARHLQNLSFTGPADSLLSLLEERTSERERKAKTWPKNAAALGRHLTRLAPALRNLGVSVTKTRTMNGRAWTIQSMTAA